MALFPVFSSSLCGGQAVGGRRKWWHLERGESGALIACLYEGEQVQGESRDREVCAMYEEIYRFTINRGTLERKSLTLPLCFV